MKGLWCERHWKEIGDGLGVRGVILITMALLEHPKFIEACGNRPPEDVPDPVYNEALDKVGPACCLLGEDGLRMLGKGKHELAAKILGAMGLAMNDVDEAAKAFDEMIPRVTARTIGPSEEDAIATEERRAERETARAVARRGRERIAKDDRTRVEKSEMIGASNQLHREDAASALQEMGAIEPLYDAEVLALLFEHSNSLRQNIDAYGTNIDGFGHRFDPIINLEAEDAKERIAHAMLLQRIHRADAGSITDASAMMPSDEEVDAMRKKLAIEMRIERSKLQHFFEFCTPDISFVQLRKRTRQDLECMGNGFWEVIRNDAGETVQFMYVPAFTVRLLPLDRERIKVKQRVRISELDFDEVEFEVRMRRYIQVVDAEIVIFKDFGDPRIISSKTGVVYPTIDALAESEPHARPATEMIHFKIHSPRSPYGIPRWIGNLLAVVGSRQSEEVNFSYFENKSVPPLAILVQGGRMASDSVDRVTQYVEANIKGKRNFHKILVIEAESAPGTASDNGKTKIDVKPLTMAQNNDALFQNYDERNIDKVGQAFRMPRMLRGDIRDFNRGTADAALTFAEMQVFQPERQDFDFMMNRKILSSMGIRFWSFTSLAPVMRDPGAMSDVVKNFVNAGVLTPEEGRELAGDVFNKEFKKIRAAWVKQPPQFTVAGITVDDDGNTVHPDDGGDTMSDLGGTDDRPVPEGVENRRKAIRKKLLQRLRGEAGLLLMLRKALDIESSEEFAAYMREHNAA